MWNYPCVKGNFVTNFNQIVGVHFSYIGKAWTNWLFYELSLAKEFITSFHVSRRILEWFVIKCDLMSVNCYLDTPCEVWNVKLLKLSHHKAIHYLECSLYWEVSLIWNDKFFSTICFGIKPCLTSKNWQFSILENSLNFILIGTGFGCTWNTLLDRNHIVLEVLMPPIRFNLHFRGVLKANCISKISCICL